MVRPMETKDTLHAQVTIPIRPPVAPSTRVSLTIQRADQTLHCYSIVGSQVESIGSLQPSIRDFCVSDRSLYALTPDGRVLSRTLGTDHSPFTPLEFDDIEAISANRESLLLLTRANRLLLMNAAGRITKECDFEHPVRCINLGRDNTVWIAGGEEVLGGYQVFWSADLEVFKQIPWPASAVSLHGDSGGILWTINSRGEVWKLHRLGEGNMPGCRQNAGCRNCRFNGYAQAMQVVATDDLFFVLHDNGVLRGYPFPGATQASLEWQDVSRFSAA